MRLRNFSLGINSYPSSSPGSNHTTARDVLNLRVDGDGYLRLAPGVERWQEFSSKVTGIARAYDHLFYLLDNGYLYVQKSDDAGEAILVAGGTELRGKLSIIDEFETFFLITSEGDDPGYYYDVETGGIKPLALLKSYRPTSFDVREHNQGIKPSEDIDNQGSYSIQYLFAEGEAEGVIGQPYSEPYQGYQVAVQVSEDDGRFEVVFNNFQFRNPNTTHISIYRRIRFFPAEGIDTFAVAATHFTYEDGEFISNDPFFPGEDDPNPVKIEDFQFLARIEKSDKDTAYKDRKAVTESFELTDIPQLYTLSEGGVPSGTRSWRYFNGYEFAATGGRLRYSEIEFGVLRHGVFPADNSINAPGDTHFVEAFDETLMFGDAGHLHVLRGYDPFNFQVYQVAAVGPVSGYAHAVLPSAGFGFIGPKGFYFYNGEQIKEISSPQLDRFFENRVAVDGAVLPLPNSESLWSVEFDDLTRYTFLLNMERLGAPIWTRLSAVFDQGTAYPIAPLGRWVFTDDGEWVFDEDTQWGFTDPNVQPLQRIFLARDVAVVEEYLWYDLGSGIRADNEWFWESNLMRGGSETVKVYDRLTLAGYGENPIDVDFNLAIKGETVAKEIRAEPFTKNSRKKRIPIKRRANALSFIVAGYGDVELRELELDSRVVGRV